jgi:hypothetical protein
MSIGGAGGEAPAEIYYWLANSNIELLLLAKVILRYHGLFTGKEIFMSVSKSPVTISTHNGSRVCVGHNLRNERSVGNPDIDPSRTHLNETLIFEPVQHAYDRIFGQALKTYNEKQKRPERQIKSYYEHIKNDAKKHPVYEMIIQVGDCLNVGNDNPVARQILKDFIEDWQNRNPNLELVGAYLHADESTLHAHLDYIPVATGYVRGMEIQNGLDKALRQQGFDGKTASLTPQILWEKSENAYLESLCVSRGFDVIHPERDKIDEAKRVHQSVEEYKTEVLANEIDENFTYNQHLLQEQAKLERENKKLQKEIDKKNNEVIKKNAELKQVQGRILSEKQATHFAQNLEKDLFGRVKPIQKLNLRDYKSLTETASKVKNGDKREKELDEIEKHMYSELRNIKENLDNRGKYLENLEKDIEKKRKDVERGLYDNTNKRLKAVETELEDMKDYFKEIYFPNGHTGLDGFNAHKQAELERQERERELERDYYYGPSL